MEKLGRYHYKFTRGTKTSDYRVVAVDTEWAKNWVAPVTIDPFCLCIHSIYPGTSTARLDIDDLYMESELYFRDDQEARQEYIDKAEQIISKYVDDNTLFVGHQIGSDLHTFVHCSDKTLPTIEYLIALSKARKNTTNNTLPNVADTRYDIKRRIVGNGQEKLRNVSLRLRVYAVQHELDRLSLTKMYNLYSQDHDRNKREMLTIMNWRHAFQTALVWLVDRKNVRLFSEKYNEHFLVTNEIIYEMGNSTFAYLNSDDYLHTMTIDGIYDYVHKYCQKEAHLCEE